MFIFYFIYLSVFSSSSTELDIDFSPPTMIIFAIFYSSILFFKTTIKTNINNILTYSVANDIV